MFFLSVLSLVTSAISTNSSMILMIRSLWWFCESLPFSFLHVFLSYCLISHICCPAISLELFIFFPKPPNLITVNVISLLPCHTTPWEHFPVLRFLLRILCLHIIHKIFVSFIPKADVFIQVLFISYPDEHYIPLSNLNLCDQWTFTDIIAAKIMLQTTHQFLPFW